MRDAHILPPARLRTLRRLGALWERERDQIASAAQAGEKGCADLLVFDPETIIDAEMLLRAVRRAKRISSVARSSGAPPKPP